ncbi:MAG: AAA family ATPase [Deltaproteobacteria bacterium]|nr:AAA family ATPase [Deltaproteobacteria bacterium]
MTLKELPLREQTFTEIREGNLLYADKTEYIYQLIKSSERNYFLSRPRRFSKTLLLHTLNELFSGNRERFKDLWISSSDYDFPKRPVIFLSLSFEASTPELLKKNLLFDLRAIAAKNNLTVDGNSPDIYFGGLIEKLCEKAEAKVAILIDEYDAPVTRMMNEPKIATANAVALRDFFVTLKDLTVGPCVRFTFLTGVNRHSLICSDLLPNHLNDISRDPRYAGLCGFTLEEFERLFADRMTETLVKLKKSGQIAPSANQDDLRAKILDWVDGYNWGGETRILNPFSLLNFFEYAAFGNYWIKTGRPGHLTALIRERPLDFLTNDPRLNIELIKTEFDKPQATSVPFHSGSLTLDNSPSNAFQTPKNHEHRLLSYYFRPPNYEVSSSYHSDCLQVILNLKSDAELKARGEELKTALKKQDAKTVEAILSSFFSAITCHQNPKNEKAFHSLTKSLLLGLGFKVHSELLGSEDRLALCLELSDQVFAVMEMKSCPIKIKLKPEENDQILARLAMDKLSTEEKNKTLADLARYKLARVESYFIISDGQDKNCSKDEINQLLIQAALKSLPQADIDQALAALAKKRLANDVIEIALLEGARASKLYEEPIEAILLKTSQEALNDLITRDYHGSLKPMAKEIIDLGLAIFGLGSRVKVTFGPKLTLDM